MSVYITYLSTVTPRTSFIKSAADKTAVYGPAFLPCPLQTLQISSDGLFI